VRFTLRLVLVFCLPVLLAGQAPERPAVSVTTAIDGLGSFDFPARVAAARTLRRADRAEVVPALEQATRQHTDEYVRFRALVLLTGMDEAVAGRLALDLIGDRNDRIRTVAYQWFEHHPAPEVLPRLLDALPREGSEFVRPALTRALAAHGTDPAIEKALRPLVLQGEDLFRGSVIAALGEFGAAYALDDILEVARLEGPLQDDAVVALGRLGAGPERQRTEVTAKIRATLAALQQTAATETQPTVSAALCLVGIDCEARLSYLRDALAFAAGREGNELLLGAAVRALGVLAVGGRPDAIEILVRSAQGVPDVVREPIALELGTVAVRRPLVMLDVVERQADPAQAADLLLEGFDMMSEDYREERCYALLRRAHWEAAAGSTRRGAAELLIQRLEF
jgi:HEAT repeat protein